MLPEPGCLHVGLFVHVVKHANEQAYEPVEIHVELLYFSKLREACGGHSKL